MKILNVQDWFVYGLCALLWYTLDINAINVCRQVTGCRCTADEEGLISAVCALDDDAAFDFSLSNLENITHISIRARIILMKPNDRRTNYSSLKTLTMDGNALGTNILKTFMDQFPNLEMLRINDCGIKEIERKAFKALNWVQTIDLSRNGNVGFQSVTNAFEEFQSRELRHLNLSSIHISEDLHEGVLPYNLLKYLQNTTLMNLDISWNRIVIFAASFHHIPNLEYINGSGTALLGHADCLSTSIGLANLKELILDYWPTSTRGYDIPTDNKPRYKHKRSEECVAMSTTSPNDCYYPPGNARTLQIQHSRISAFYVDFTVKTCTENNTMVNLLVASAILQRPMNEIRGLLHLEVFDISYPQFESDTISGIVNTTFIDMPSLQKALIPGNRLHLFSDQELQNLFVNCGELRLVDMSSNNLTNIPANMFINNTLLRHINMSRNNLDTLTVVLSHLTYLETLDLSYNNFKTLDHAYITRQIFNYSKTIIYLHFNQFECDCTLNALLSLDVRELMLTCREEGLTRYVHRDNTTTTPMLFECSEVETNSNIYLITGCVSGFVLLSTTLVIFYYCKRRRTERTQKKPNATPEPFVHVIPIDESRSVERNPKFLAFLAYSHDDGDLVCNVLYPKLDAVLRQLMPNHDSNSLLTLYDKNFLPGEDIDLICEQAVIQSYVTVAVISQSFIESFWCSYEMKTAIHASIPVIPLYLGNVDESKLKGIFKHVYNNKVRMLLPIQTDANNIQDEINTVMTRLGQAICASISAFKEKEHDNKCKRNSSKIA